jgi:hypothetical protein
MWTRPLGDMLMDVAGSLLSLSSGQQVVHATSVELTLPIDVRVRRTKAAAMGGGAGGGADALLFCCDVPAWRWRTDWDPPFGRLRLTLEETPWEIAK